MPLCSYCDHYWHGRVRSISFIARYYVLLSGSRAGVGGGVEIQISPHRQQYYGVDSKYLTYSNSYVLNPNSSAAATHFHIFEPAFRSYTPILAQHHQFATKRLNRCYILAGHSDRFSYDSSLFVERHFNISNKYATKKSYRYIDFFGCILLCGTPFPYISPVQAICVHGRIVIIALPVRWRWSVAFSTHIDGAVRSAHFMNMSHTRIFVAWMSKLQTMVCISPII